jgi:uncharacterized protein YecT (DUF1311 family)
VISALSPSLSPRRAAAGSLAALALALILAAPLSAATAAKAASPPVIHELFTLLPCPAHPRSTLELEGCAEHQIVRTDHRIDAVASTIYRRLFDDAARRRFIAAQAAWLTYRKADCTSRSDQYEGGTLAGLVAAQCTADRSAERLKDLQEFAKSLAGP